MKRDQIGTSQKVRFNVNKIYLNLFLCSLFLLPFINDFPLFPKSHFARTPSMFTLLLSAILLVSYLLLGKVNFYIHQTKLTFLLLAYVFWAILSGVFNFFIIGNLNSIEISGYAIFLKNITMLVFYFYICLFAYNALRNNEDAFLKIRNVCMYSFLIVIPYALLEILSYYYEINLASYLLRYLEPIFHDRNYAFTDDVSRVRGYAFEPSYFSLYIAFVSPWLLSYLIEIYEKKKFLFSLLIFLFFTIIIYTQSRITYITVIIQVAIYVWLILHFQIKKELFKKNLLIKVFIFTAFLLFIVSMNYQKIFWTFQSLTSFEPTNISNLERLASMHSAMLLSLDHPIYGVGFGLAGAYLPDYYPDYAFLSYSMVFWANAREINFGTPVFSVLPRVLAETGLIGGALFLGAWLTAMYSIYKKILINFRNNNRIPYVGISLFTTLLGLLSASFGVDDLGFVGYWLSFGMTMAYVSNHHILTS